MPKYNEIPGDAFITRDIDAAERLLAALKSNIDIAVKAGDAKNAIGYATILCSVSVVLDDIEEAVRRLDEVSGLLDVMDFSQANAAETVN